MKLTDSALLLSLVSGGLYFSGYTFNLHYLDYFSAEPELFHEDVSKNIFLGWIAISERGILLFCTLGLYAFFKIFLLKYVNLSQEVIYLKNSLAMKLCLLLTIAYILYLNASGLGESYAKSQYTYEITTEFYFSNCQLDGKYRILAFSKGNYLLLGIDKKLLVISQEKVKHMNLNP
ncbi:hypothetical protein [Pseudoalteromonas sp.]|uniref:hypothetical protein n=1 Tax=Pseudoalteromonas sp. TaxID=53249 RepID=UPI0026039D14|nr:hypothetical protein [Pseudoalteromonas sp.]MCP4588483.1 hypothetical protein [Pseudoalteromonas sp.]